MLRLNDDDVFVVAYVDGSIKVWFEGGEIGTRKERKARVYAAREMADSLFVWSGTTRAGIYSVNPAPMFRLQQKVRRE